MFGVAVFGLGTATATAVAASPLLYDDVAVSGVTFQTHEGLTIAGKVFVPAGHSGRLPDMVLVHGSGNSTWQDLLAEAEGFARQGIVVLVANKRTIGYSFTSRDYSLLAADSVAGWAVLRERSEVDRTEVGIWGLSEGGWGAPMAAARQREIAFLITVGASGVSPLRQETWSLATELRTARLDPGAVLRDRTHPGRGDPARLAGPANRLRRDRRPTDRRPAPHHPRVWSPNGSATRTSRSR